MKQAILIKNGEIALKGLNRGTFEDRLIKNIKLRIKDLGPVNITKSQSTITILPEADSYDIDMALLRLKTVFGIASYSKAYLISKDIEDIKQQAVSIFKLTLEKAKTFKVESKRSDKSFILKSPEISATVGEHILTNFNNLKVDVIDPEVTINIEVRDKHSYIYSKKLTGAGGLPVGSSGMGVLLLSGGIDSPVAAYMMAKRGVKICAVNFESPPYTSERARLKVISLANKLNDYCGEIYLNIVPFTDIQLSIKKHCPDVLFTIIMRRYMVRIAMMIAKMTRADALITGESVGQVASQTMSAIAMTDNVADIPIFRPLIGMDKQEIVTIARRIDTFETSILPYEDCCTIFTPRHPKTRPRLDEVLEAENKLFNIEDMVGKAFENMKLIKCGG